MQLSSYMQTHTTPSGHYSLGWSRPEQELDAFHTNFRDHRNVEISIGGRLIPDFAVSIGGSSCRVHLTMMWTNQ